MATLREEIVAKIAEHQAGIDDLKEQIRIADGEGHGLFEKSIEEVAAWFTGIALHVRSKPTPVTSITLQAGVDVPAVTAVHIENPTPASQVHDAAVGVAPIGIDPAIPRGLPVSELDTVAAISGFVRDLSDVQAVDGPIEPRA